MSQIYPFNSANLQGNITTNKVIDPSMKYSWGFHYKKPNCESVTYKLNKEKEVMFGYQKPINEKCPVITGTLTYDPSTSGNSLWNNSTRRKTIVNTKRN